MVHIKHLSDEPRIDRVRATLGFGVLGAIHLFGGFKWHRNLHFQVSDNFNRVYFPHDGASNRNVTNVSEYLDEALQNFFFACSQICYLSFNEKNNNKRQNL